MSNAALATNVVNLEDYRRSRGEKRSMAPRPVHPVPTAAPAVRVYWVPVWVW